MELPGVETVVLANKLSLDLTSTNPHIAIKGFNPSDNEELPAAGALPAIADFLKIPEAFLFKLDVDLAESLVNALLARSTAPAMIRYTDMDIKEIAHSSRKTIDPRDVVDVIHRVMPPDSKVVEFWRTSKEFHLDLVVADIEARGAYGKKAIDDYSLGGLRVTQHGATPEVSQYWYRLACTNGQTRKQDEVLSMRAGGAEDFLIEFEDLCNRTFAAMEGTIKAFYDLKSHEVENVEQAVLRWTNIQGVNDKTRMALLEMAPSYFASNAVEDTERITRFDVASFVTNAAVNMEMPAAARYALEAAGGAIVDRHHTCGTCQSVLD
jgi:hypothetical protein